MTDDMLKLKDYRDVSQVGIDPAKRDLLFEAPLVGRDHSLSSTRRESDTSGPHGEITWSDFPVVDCHQHHRVANDRTKLLG